MKKSYLVFVIFFLSLILDQTLKLFIKLNYRIGQESNFIGDWLKLYFIENNGMALNYSFIGINGKVFLVALRLIIAFVLTFFIFRFLKKNIRLIPVLGLVFILAGTIGNLIDNTFYGLFFSESTKYSYSEFLANGNGYAPAFDGKVVDMLQLNLVDISKENAPKWLPDMFYGYDGRFKLFRFVFNLADLFIIIGVVIALFFDFKSKEKQRSII
ncbi:MAG: signal peptidase II [Hyphomicrobiales bacterium]